MFPDTKYAIVAGLAILVFSALIILTRPSQEKRPVLDFLAFVWLFTMLRPLVQPLLVNAGLIEHLPRFLLLPAIPLIYGPLFYLFIRKLTRPDVRLRMIEWLPPALLFVVIALIPYFGGGPPAPGLSGPPGPPAPRDPGFMPFRDVEMTVLYSALIFILLRKHNRRIAEKLSLINEMKSLRSAYVLLALFLFINLFLAIHRTTGTIWPSGPELNQELHGSGFLLLILSFSLFLARQRPVFSESDDSGGTDDRPTEPENLIFQNDEIPAREANLEGKEDVPEGPSDQEVQELRNSIESQRLYLDSDLTLESLARMLGRSRHQVSFLLNQGVNQNFYRYINGLRVEHASELLADPGYSNWPVIRVALESGFSSKATFNRLFKEYKGGTPMEWRRKAS